MVYPSEALLTGANKNLLMINFSVAQNWQSSSLQLMASIEADFLTELAQIQIESIGWTPLDEAAYLHIGSETSVIEVVGLPKPEIQGLSVLWVL